MNPAIPSNVCAFFTMNLGDDDLHAREYQKPSQEAETHRLHHASMLDAGNDDCAQALSLERPTLNPKISSAGASA
jgi:hypothetical protein